MSVAVDVAIDRKAGSASRETGGGAGGGTGAMYLVGGAGSGQPAQNRKINGCSGSFHPRQVMALALYVTSLVGWCVFVVPFIPTANNHQLIAVVVYFGLFALGVSAYIAIEVVDPVHARVLTRLERPPPDKTKFAANDFRACGLCDIWIEPTTKHCHECGKCIENFDHHCQYLNTCVGGNSNYHYFAILISTLVILFIIQICETFYIYSIASSDPASSIFEWSYFGTFAGRREVYLLVLSLSAVAPLVGVVPSCGLLGFHIWVVGIRRLTTWSWILENRRLADLKPKVLTKADIEAEKRRTAAQAAEREQWKKDQEENAAKRAAMKRGGAPAAGNKLTMDRVAAKMKADAALAAQVGVDATIAATAPAATSGGAAAAGGPAVPDSHVRVNPDSGAIEMNLSAKAEEERRRALLARKEREEADSRAREERYRSSLVYGSADHAGDDKTQEWRAMEEQNRIDARKAANAAAAEAAAATAAGGPPPAAATTTTTSTASSTTNSHSTTPTLTGDVRIAIHTPLGNHILATPAAAPAATALAPGEGVAVQVNGGTASATHSSTATAASASDSIAINVTASSSTPAPAHTNGTTPVPAAQPHLLLSPSLDGSASAGGVSRVNSTDDPTTPSRPLLPVSPSNVVLSSSSPSVPASTLLAPPPAAAAT